MDINEHIKPFVIVKHENSTSLILDVGKYKLEIFLEREDEGFEGNGYDWSSLAQVFLYEKMPQLQDLINFDPEAGMFCAYSESTEAIENFATQFKAMCEDEDLMRDLFYRAELD